MPDGPPSDDHAKPWRTTDSEINAAIAELGERASIMAVRTLLHSRNGASPAIRRVTALLRAHRERVADQVALAAQAVATDDPIAHLRALSPDTAKAIFAKAKADMEALQAPALAEANRKAEEATIRADAADAVAADLLRERESISGILARAQAEAVVLQAPAIVEANRKAEEATARADRLAAVANEVDRLRDVTKSALAETSTTLNAVINRLTVTESALAAHDARAEERRAALDQTHAIVATLRDDLAVHLAKQTAALSGIVTDLATTITTAADARDRSVSAEAAVGTLVRAIADLRTTISQDLATVLAHQAAATAGITEALASSMTRASLAADRAASAEAAVAALQQAVADMRADLARQGKQ